MANMIREKFEQELGKRFEQIEKTLERTFEKTIEKTMKSPAGAKAQATAMSAKQTLDQVLLGLEHKGYNLKEPQDLIQTVGRKVLERANEIANEVAKAAEDVRSQVAAKPYSPAWVKDLKIPQVNFSMPTGASKAAGATEGEVGEQLESNEDSKDERSAGTVVNANPVVQSTSMPEASKSDKSSKKSSKSSKNTSASLN